MNPEMDVPLDGDLVFPSPLNNPRMIGEDEVHVFYADADKLSMLLSRCKELLSGKEYERALMFSFEREKNIYILTHGLLRVIIGSCTNNFPKKIRFAKGRYGKPMIVDDGNPHSIRFNVSHSNGLIAFAVAQGREIGIDIEFMNSEFPYQDIIQRFFSPREVASIRSLPEYARQEAFYSYWTLKEAVMKATGRGFSLPPEQFEVALDPPRILCLRGELESGFRWSMQHVFPGDRYAAAVAAVGGGNLQIRQWNLAPPPIFPNG